MPWEIESFDFGDLVREIVIGAITRDNTHSFISGDWTFAHNGGIIKPDLGAKNDSQWFFEQLLLRNAKEIITEAIRTQTKAIHGQYKYTSLTLLLFNDLDLYAYRDFTNFDYYYTMFFTVLDDQVMVSQERFFDSDWVELNNYRLRHVSDSEINLQNLE
jgi:predicted glutamine amidotransferase